MAGNQKKGQLTWGEGGISSPNEDSASIPTPTEPQQKPSWHSLAKKLVKWFVAQMSRPAQQRLTQPFRDRWESFSPAGLLQHDSPRVKAGSFPKAQVRGGPSYHNQPLQSALSTCSGTSLHFHPKPGLPPTMALFLRPTESKPHQPSFRVWLKS